MAKKKTEDTETLKALVIEAILEKKGQDTVTLDLREIHDTVSDYFIIAHGDSNTQVNAIFQSIMESTKKHGHLPYHSEGMKNGEWIIVDFVDVVAHIFHREKRDFYQLEELWNDAKVTKHDPGAAIKPKAVRQPNKKDAEPYIDEPAVVAPKKRAAPARKIGAKKAPAKKAAPTAKKAAASKKSATTTKTKKK